MKKLIFIGFLILAVSLWTAPAKAAQSLQVPLNPKTIPQFVDPLPGLYTIFPPAPGSTQQSIVLNMNEFQYQVLSKGTPLPGLLPAGTTVQPNNTATWTWVWGYQEQGQAITSYIGPVVLATRGTPTEIKFVNNLGSVNTTKVEFYKYSIDQTLHWADPIGAEANYCADPLPTDPNFLLIPGTNRKYPAFGSDCAKNYEGPIPAVVHLHGGEVPPVLDGGPDAWVTSSGLKGHGFHSKDGAAATNYAIYRYPNVQEAAPIWFHDHALGITRLNVYAGMAGAYLINDPNLNLVLPTGLRPYGLTSTANDTTLTGDTPIIPLVIQDRMFDTTGQLFFPGDSAAKLLWSTNPEHPYWVPEFVGDTIVVNGKTWPFLNVQARRYRFLFLNGSNARTYELSLPNPVTGAKVPFYVIGTDGGYLNGPVPINTLTIMPGERYDVIINFAGLAGTNLVLKNTGKTPYPRGAQPAGATLGRIIQFRVGAVPVGFVDNSYNPALGTPIRTGANAIKSLTTGGVPPANPALTRLLTLNEDLAPPSVVTDPVTGVALTAYPGGPLEVLVNNTKWMGKFNTNTRGDFTCKSFPAWDGSSVNQCYSELPNEGDTEVWEIVNLTADAHPMHLHAVQFQIINRQNFDLAKYNAFYNLQFTGTGPGGTLPANCVAQTYCPGYGPPLSYDKTANALSGGKFGGNPDVKPYLMQAAVPPAPQEAGWKDTAVVMPGMVTRFAVRWAPQDTPINTIGSFDFDPNSGHGYVWHCHIIDHEDNEMMRPTSITPLNDNRTYKACADRTNIDPVNCY